MEVGRAGRAVLGYDHPRKHSRLLCRRGFRDGFDQPLRRDPALPLRFVPPAGDEPVELCGQPVQGRCEVQFRQVQGPRIQGDAHDGRHHRPRTGKGRTDHREDRRRPRRPGCAPRGAGALEEDPRNGAEGPPYGSGHHGRGRHARRAGSALRHAGGDRLRRRGAEVPRSGGLRRFGEDGRRARRLPGLRRREGGEQPDDRPYPRGRSGALRGDDEGGPPRPTTAPRPTTSTGWPRSRCRAPSRNGWTIRSR